MAKYGTLSYHGHTEVKQALTMPDNKLKGILSDSDTGDPLTAAQVRDFLISELRNNHDYFTVCDNRKEDGSCAGHPTKGEN